MIGLEKDQLAVIKAIKDAIRDIEGMEYPEDEAITVADKEISWIHFYSMEPEDFKTEFTLNVLNEIITQMINPSIVFVNHHHPYEATHHENTAGVKVTQCLGKRLMGDLEIQKNFELPGNRTKEDYVQPAFQKMKSMKMQLN